MTTYYYALPFITAPNGPPSDVTITILSSLQARINWTSPPYLERNGIITYYLINISDTLDQFKDLINVTDTWYIANGKRL